MIVFDSNDYALDLAGWNSDGPIFARLIEEVKPEVIVEVGTWKGASAIHMAKVCERLGLKTTVMCIDTWLGSYEFGRAGDSERDLRPVAGYPTVYYQCLANIIKSHLLTRVELIPQCSAIAARWLKNRGVKAGLIYQDASHDYEDVKRDVADYWELLAPGGVMFGDDFLDWDSVSRAVRESGHAYTTQERYWVMHKDA